MKTTYEKKTTTMRMLQNQTYRLSLARYPECLQALSQREVDLDQDLSQEETQAPAFLARTIKSRLYSFLEKSLVENVGEVSRGAPTRARYT